jgi:hypothetical protein
MGGVRVESAIAASGAVYHVHITFTQDAEFMYLLHNSSATFAASLIFGSRGGFSSCHAHLQIAIVRHLNRPVPRNATNRSLEDLATSQN